MGTAMLFRTSKLFFKALLMAAMMMTGFVQGEGNEPRVSLAVVASSMRSLL